jgi:hypothetical protein
VRLLAGAQCLAGPGVVELAEADGISGFRGPALLRGVAGELEHTRYAPGFSFRRIEGDTVTDRAIEDARDRKLAAMLGLERLDHVGDRIAVARHFQALQGLGNAGNFVSQRLQQAPDAVRAARDAEKHRTNSAFAQLLREVVEDSVSRRLDVVE